MEKQESKCSKKQAFDALNNANQWILIANDDEYTIVSVQGGPELMGILAKAITKNSGFRRLINGAMILAALTP